MSDDRPLLASPKTEMSPGMKDLRAELKATLESKFITRLAEATTLPKSVAEALATLLSTDVPTSSQVIAVLSADNSVQQEESNE